MSILDFRLAGQQLLWLLAPFRCWAAGNHVKCMKVVVWCAFGAYLSH